MIDWSVGFENWKAEVNQILENRVGVGCDDLPDFNYADAYDSGQTPKEVGEAVIAEALDSSGFSSDEDDFEADCG